MYTNRNNLELAMAVWLANDEYDGVNEDHSISVTTLLKPTKAIILSLRHPSTGEVDVATLIASSLGTAIHDSIEKAWLNKPEETMQKLGLPKAMWKDLRVNPVEHDEDYFNVYMEQRESREHMGFNINGKYDFIFDGQVQDNKSTGTWSYMKDSNAEKYSLQGGLYKWLNPDKVTEDTMMIHFIFTDWSKLGYIKNPKNYPALRVLSKTYPIMNEVDTTSWLTAKLGELRSCWDKPEAEMPMCTPEDLWQSEPVYKYYKDVYKMARSTGNFKTYAEADRKKRESGGMGVIITDRGAVKACKWCPAIANCQQARSYILDGTLKIED